MGLSLVACLKVMWNYCCYCCGMDYFVAVVVVVGGATVVVVVVVC